LERRVRFSVIECVLARPDQRDRGAVARYIICSSIAPAALLVEVADVALVHQIERDDHVEHDQDAADAREEAGDHQQRRQHFAGQHAIANEAGKPCVSTIFMMPSRPPSSLLTPCSSTSDPRAMRR
jgi:hypothetical protein